jgi:hypothetical protein
MHPGLAPSLLGKRGRDSTTSDMSGIIEDGQKSSYTDDELVGQVTRHDKKRARTEAEENSTPVVEDEELHLPPRTPRTRTESLYIDPGPPRTPLPRFYGTGPSPTDDLARQSPDKPHLPPNLNLLPAPASPSALDFPFPEQPQSPTPAGPARPPGPMGVRTDTFRSFGLAPISRPRSAVSTEPGMAVVIGPDDDAINPAALTAISEPVELTAETLTVQDEDPAGPVYKRTMYGTELDGESRFGDFGLDNGNSFWTNGPF